MNKYILLIIFSMFFVRLLAQKPDSTNVHMNIPIITLTDNDLNSDGRSQDISTILQSTEDVFTNTAGYTFGQARFRIRGYDNQNAIIMLNGLEANDAETGRAYYGNWGGLNDVMRNKVSTTALNFSDYSFGNIGGVTNIITRASEYREGTSISYSLANKNYRHRAMLTYSSGLNDKGWAYTISASTRLANEGYVKGTFYEAYAYFLALEKIINANHSLNFTVIGSPTRSGRAGVATLEQYELTGDNYYNPNWGYQNGKIRNSRVGNFHQPRTALTHYWKINDKSKLTTSMGYLFGRSGTTGLNWYDVADPRPNYYRNMPSYYETGSYMYNYLTDLWKNDKTYGQLNWDSFFHANRKNLYTVNDEGGNIGNDVTGNRAKYIIEENRNDIKRFDFSSLFDMQLSENGKLVAGINAFSNTTHIYKTLNDLLGADWWLDIDQFAERDFNDEFTIQNDIQNPNKVIKEGEIFGYNYSANINKAKIFGQTEYKFKAIDFFAGIELSYTSFWRTGHFQNGKFPQSSYGNSNKKHFINYALKAGVDYKITGRHHILLNVAHLTRAPYFRDAYISPRTRDNTVNNLKNEIIMSGDISYLFTSPSFLAKITGYYTQINNSINNSNFYHDELRSFVNYIMTNVNELHYGLELGIEAKITPTINMTAAVGYGNFLYNSRPNVTIAQDNSSKILAENRIVYIKNYHLGGMPEFVTSVGIKYNSPKYWNIGLNANYFDESYVTINPEKHTQEALDIYVSTDPQTNMILKQEKLKPGMTLDLWGGKSWRIAYKYSIGFNLSISNILNNKNFATNGFEQFRFDKTNIDKFQNKYFYMYGRSYFLNLYFRF